MAHNHQNGHAGENQQRQISPDASRVLQPLADVQSDDVQRHRDQQHGQRYPQQKRAVIGQCSAAAGHRIGSHRRACQQQSRKIEDGIDPVGPAGDKAVEWSERVARPRVNAALLGESRGELVDHQRARHEEEDARPAPTG